MCNGFKCFLCLNNILKVDNAISVYVYMCVSVCL